MIQIAQFKALTASPAGMMTPVRICHANSKGNMPELSTYIAVMRHLPAG